MAHIDKASIRTIPTAHQSMIRIITCVFRPLSGASSSFFCVVFVSVKGSLTSVKIVVVVFYDELSSIV